MTYAREEAARIRAKSTPKERWVEASSWLYTVNAQVEAGCWDPKNPDLQELREELKKIIEENACC